LVVLGSTKRVMSPLSSTAPMKSIGNPDVILKAW
jgi:hypothetical protein